MPQRSIRSKIWPSCLPCGDQVPTRESASRPTSTFGSGESGLPVRIQTLRQSWSGPSASCCTRSRLSSSWPSLASIGRGRIPTDARWCAATAANASTASGRFRQAAKKAGWTPEQSDALIALLLDHAGYLHSHGHALGMAYREFRQACLKVNPASSATYFAEILNHGGSTSYGMGAAVENAPFRCALVAAMRQPELDRFFVEADAPEFDNAQSAEAPNALGALRVPLTAIRGLSPGAAQHVLAVRAMFGPFDSLARLPAQGGPQFGSVGEIGDMKIDAPVVVVIADG